MTTIRRDVWNTFKITAYDGTANDNGDRRAHGGVHRHEVRKTKTGWQKRIVVTNGRFDNPCPPVPLSDADGEALFTQAEKY